MPVDRTLLRQLSQSVPPPPEGIAGLIHGIHRIPELRDWVTLESVAITPIPVQRGNHWSLLTLLAVPVREAKETPGWNPPWGAVEWSMPEGRVLQKIHLSKQSNLPQVKFIPLIPVAESRIDRSRSQRESDLFQALETFFSDPDPNNLPSLANHYPTLLASELYAYYQVLVPASQSWLIPRPRSNSDNLDSKHSTSLPLSNWLRQSREIASHFALPTVAADLDRLETRFKLPGFRLAFVGEFSRGKSSLINRLLERDILPVGAVPTTASLIAISPGIEEQMEINPGQSNPELRPLTQLAWENLTATDDQGHEQTILKPIRITLNHPWLHSLDVEIIDTPGAGDLSEKRAAIVQDLLSQCDAAVLVISASLPFSLTERTFLEEKVIGQHVPRVLVVVSKLDTIDFRERMGVFHDLQARIAQVSPIIPVLPTYPIDETTSEATILKTIREQIETMVAQGDRYYWRCRQIAKQLIDSLQQMSIIGSEAIAAANLSAAERTRKLEEIETHLKTADLQWEDLRLTLDQRRLQRDQQLRNRIRSTQGDLLESLKLELERVPEPATWWRRDLPFRVRRELMILSRQAEDFIIKAIMQDIEWFDGEVQQAFDTHITTHRQSQTAPIELQPKYEDIELSDTKRIRLLTRLGCSAGVLCGYIFGGPLGVVASTSIWFVGERFLTQQVETQRQLLLKELDRSLDQAINVYCSAISDRLRQLYSQLADDTQRDQQLWRSAQKETIHENLLTQEDIPWYSLIQQADNLKKTIVTTISNESTTV